MFKYYLTMKALPIFSLSFQYPYPGLFLVLSGITIYIFHVLFYSFVTTFAEWKKLPLLLELEHMLEHICKGGPLQVLIKYLLSEWINSYLEVNDWKLSEIY